MTDILIGVALAIFIILTVPWFLYGVMVYWAWCWKFFDRLDKRPPQKPGDIRQCPRDFMGGP